MSTFAIGQANINPEINWELTSPGIEVSPPRIPPPSTTTASFVAYFFNVSICSQVLEAFKQGFDGSVFKRTLKISVDGSGCQGGHRYHET